MTDFSFKLNCSSITRWEKVGELSNKVCGSAAVYTLEPQTSQWFLINGRSKQNSFICLSTAFCGENKAQNYFLFLSLSSFTFASCCKAFKAIICLPLCFTPSLKSHWDWFVSALSPGWFSSFCKIFFTRIYSASSLIAPHWENEKCDVNVRNVSKRDYMFIIFGCWPRCNGARLQCSVKWKDQCCTRISSGLN